MINLIIEKIINQLIVDNLVDISQLQQKTINIHLNNINIDLCFYFDNNRIYALNEKKPSDVEIKLNFKAFLDLLNKTDIQELIRENKIAIIGEVRIAQILIDILKASDIKGKIIEIAPNFAIDYAKKIKQELVSGSLKDKIIEKLIQPKIYK